MNDWDCISEFGLVNCLHFVNGSGLVEVATDLREGLGFVVDDPSTYSDTELHIAWCGRRSYFAALKIKLILNGIVPRKVDAYLTWQTADEQGEARRGKVFHDCVIGNNDLPEGNAITKVGPAAHGASRRSYPRRLDRQLSESGEGRLHFKSASKEAGASK